MNIRLNIILLVFISFFISCNKDNDSPENENTTEENENITEENLPGTYNLKSITLSKAIDPQSDGTFDETDITPYVDCTNRLIFNSDGTFSTEISNLFQYYSEGGGSITSYNPITCETQGSYPGTYSFGGTTVTLNYSTSYPRIIDVNGSELILTRDDNYFITQDEGELVYDFSVTTTYIFEK